MKWSTLHNLYSGLIGKVIIIISLFSTLATIPILNEIKSVHIAITLLGAVIIILGYIIYIIFIPDIIKNFTLYNYINYNLKREKRKYLNKIDEFTLLEKDFNYTNNLYIFSENNMKLKEFKGINDSNTIDGKSSIYSLSMIKYAYINTLYIKTRFFLTFLFILGIIFIYHSPIYKIFTLICQGLT